MDLYDQGVGGDYTIAPGGSVGAGSGPVDAFGNAIYGNMGIDPTSEQAKQTSQKLNQHPKDAQAAETEDPTPYQPDVRDAKALEQKQTQSQNQSETDLSKQESLGAAVPNAASSTSVVPNQDATKAPLV
jgi:hypothetical protein